LSIAIIHVGIYIAFGKYISRLSDTSEVLISILTIIIAIVMFIAYFLMLTKKFINYIREISEGINQISQGNLSNRINIRNEDEFAYLADKLNQMAGDIKEIMENERKIEYSKNELITSVAHDLRTPLTSIIGYLDLVSSKELGRDTQMKYISIAYNKSKRLEKLIEDLFTYTKFNFGEVKADYSEVDMVKLLNQLVDEFYPSFTENQLQYEFIADSAAAVIKADGNLLARAFANLISNAIKYGKDGKNILINLNKNENGIVIKVTNYGVIIPIEDLERIFQRFYRVETSRSSETGGSGLGLAIAQSIIEMHGGIIYADSNPEGTVFTVELKNEPPKPGSTF
jgi:signal transduction histidine kinase